MFKHLHLTLAVISISFFTLRFAWLLINSDQLNRKWVKITPHIIDTLLLVIGAIMVVQLAINPFEQVWLAEKLLALAAYIFTGVYTLKFAKNRMMQIFGYLGAMAWVIVIVRIALTKESVFFSQ
tara:strand:- start:307 stop:678 length:372 start_codon:yes stop_codon:yes gene_type:complete